MAITEPSIKYYIAKPIVFKKLSGINTDLSDILEASERFVKFSSGLLVYYDKVNASKSNMNVVNSDGIYNEYVDYRLLYEIPFISNPNMFVSNSSSSCSWEWNNNHVSQTISDFTVTPGTNVSYIHLNCPTLLPANAKLTAIYLSAFVLSIGRWK